MNFSLRGLIRSRVFMGLASFVFVVLSINVAPVRCSAAGRRMLHTEPSRINQILSRGHASGPLVPSGNHCRCSASMAVCCKGAIERGPKETYVALHNRDTTSPFSLLQVSPITPFFYIAPRSRKMAPQHPFSFCQEEPFLVNCTFLI